ncbi:MAG: hypothetical protein A3K19_04695 [Lentisphaerae bacterium RIFOXYB12_FULL_65_16]|nr:MAG: hypothetical protein A3K18_11435 [Lentisphaerae bacterium RIFOXYA12_64_32]OGV84029.1 MAG: hypothetical protein A3K19_04695 [Lentisphaerae bacterium RIFOXYB12_FULL_65_16]
MPLAAAGEAATGKPAPPKHDSPPFHNPEAAAQHALASVIAYSVATRREMGGRIYYQDGSFYHTMPTIAPEPTPNPTTGPPPPPQSCDPGTIPQGTLDAGMYHTHPLSGNYMMSRSDKTSVYVTASRIYVLPAPGSGDALVEGKYRKRMGIWQNGQYLRGQWEKWGAEWKPWNEGDTVPPHHASTIDRCFANGEKNGPFGPATQPAAGIYHETGEKRGQLKDGITVQYDHDGKRP